MIQILILVAFPIPVVNHPSLAVVAILAVVAFRDLAVNQWFQSMVVAILAVEFLAVARFLVEGLVVARILVVAIHLLAR